MSGLDKECAAAFLKMQERLFDVPVAENEAEAMDFLEECMAEVFDTEKELREYMEAEGIDLSEYSDVSEALEVFTLPDGRFLYVEA